MSTLFDFLNDINHKKEDLRHSPTFDNDINMFMINRGMSQYLDTAVLAAEVNKMGSFEPRAQYLFYLKTVRPKKRFDKWTKALEMPEDVQYIMDYYCVSKEKAVEYRKLLTDQQLVTIVQRYELKNKNKSSRK